MFQTSFVSECCLKASEDYVKSLNAGAGSGGSVPQPWDVGAVQGWWFNNFTAFPGAVFLWTTAYMAVVPVRSDPACWLSLLLPKDRQGLQVSPCCGGNVVHAGVCNKPYMSLSVSPGGLNFFFPVLTFCTVMWGLCVCILVCCELVSSHVAAMWQSVGNSCFPCYLSSYRPG